MYSASKPCIIRHIELLVYSYLSHQLSVYDQFTFRLVATLLYDLTQHQMNHCCTFFTSAVHRTVIALAMSPLRHRIINLFNVILSATYVIWCLNPGWLPMTKRDQSSTGESYGCKSRLDSGKLRRLQAAHHVLGSRIELGTK